LWNHTCATGGAENPPPRRPEVNEEYDAKSAVSLLLAWVRERQAQNVNPTTEPPAVSVTEQRPDDGLGSGQIAAGADGPGLPYPKLQPGDLPEVLELGDAPHYRNVKSPINLSENLRLAFCATKIALNMGFVLRKLSSLDDPGGTVSFAVAELEKHLSIAFN